jgi:hypothetical protein
VNLVLRGAPPAEVAAVGNVPRPDLVHAADLADDLDIEEHLLLLVPEPFGSSSRSSLFPRRQNQQRFSSMVSRGICWSRDIILA